MTESKQREIMSALGDNGNYDVIPVAVIETEQHHSLTEDDFNFVDEILECDDEKMDEYCQEREGMTLDEYCESVQTECLTPEL